MPNARSSIGMTTLNKYIYVSGGMNASDYEFSSVLKYSPRTDTWTKVKPMNEARRGHELISLRGFIYAIGAPGTKTVERYSPLIDEWAFVAQTNHVHIYFGATSHQNKIYVLSENGFEVFNPEFDTWHDLPSLNFGWGSQLVSINDRLLAVGVGEGSNKGKASKTIYEFNITNYSWIHLPDMNAPRLYHRAVVVN